MKKTLKLLLVLSMTVSFMVAGVTASSTHTNVQAADKMIIEPDYYRV